MEEEQPTSDDVTVDSRPGFTSERFKIEVQGLPRYFNVAQAKKLFIKKLQLQVHKVKVTGTGNFKNGSYLFLNFKDEEERERAIGVIDGFEFKKRKLKAFKAKAAKDPLMKALKENRNEDKKNDSSLSFKEILFNAVCPLHDVPYSRQLEIKTELLKEVISSYYTELFKANPSIKSAVDEGSIKLPEVEAFVESPVMNGYRNKCEFTVGRHPETEEVEVGFRISSYRSGSVSVLTCDEVPFVSETMKKVVKSFRDFVKDSGYEPYDPVSLSGYWQQLTLRSNFENAIMAIAVINPQTLKEEEKNEIKTKIAQHFQSCSEKDETLKFASVFVQFVVRKSKGDDEAPAELVSGSETFCEKLRDLKFNISPKSFFQVNTKAAERLYETAGELAKLDSNSDLIDVCCGTGTIGLFLANKCRKVYGIELVEDAVINARTNARMNGILNAEFRSGRAERLLSEVFKSIESNTDDQSSSQIVAIVDPPRGGLHPKAVHALRYSKVETLVFVSCDAKAAMQNFINLGKPRSNVYFGDPFIPKRIIPVDLFPYTKKHFELLILFERFQVQV